MARPLRIEYPGAFYHVTSRGNEKKDIFRDTKDRQRFLRYLESATKRYGASMHVYCLMSNHYHLLLETPKGNLSQIMRHINGAYTTYFNVRHQRAGHLFQGRYKAILVEFDEYAKELSRYIHLNPVRAGIVENPGKYPWSSYQYYVGHRKAPEWLVAGFILSYFSKKVFSARKTYREFVQTFIGPEYESPLQNVVASTILGSSDFVQKIKERYVDTEKVDRNLPALRELSTGITVERVKTEVESVFGNDAKLSRKVSLYVCHRYSGLKLKEIGNHFGIGESGVSEASRRVALRIDTDRRLRKKIQIIKNTLEL
jgi:putative transposase